MKDETEIDALLEREPRNVDALVEKADLRSAAGDDRAALAFYRAALSAAASAQPLPQSLRPVIERAQDGIARALSLFEHYLETSLAETGFPEGKRPERFQESVDLMLGRKSATLQLQRPGSYYFPGLPQRRYYEREALPWSDAVEASAPAIRAELDSYLEAGVDGFSPYLLSDPSRPRSEFHGLVDNPEWSTLYLWQNGGPVQGVTERFPVTMATMEGLDLPRIGVRAPSILFSRLAAGARIPPHHGVMNARLICHLPLIVPPGCGFRVGGEAREWCEGELLVFDDTVEHEAWNNGASDRIILIFDVWRPEITADERRAIAAVFAAVDAYGG